MNFGNRTVIEDLTFDVQRGETFGFLGSNGSGKTTTLRALLGIYRATSGTLHVDGKPFTPENGGKLGYLPEERGLYKKEPVLDVMVYFGQLKGLSRQAARVWSLAYLERVELADKSGTRLDRLSGGQQQKIQLGVTIMSDPELLILDEPTKGFDPVNRRLLMDIIDEQKAGGATIVMVTHQMEEVERLCDRVLLLKDGKAEAYGTVSEVQARYGTRTATVVFTGTLPEDPSYAVLQFRHGDARSESGADLALTEDADGAELLRHLIGRGLQVSSFTTSRTSLEDIFLRIYGAGSQTLEGAL
ncbi:ATP-binding cassette domain-containing protein [Paeniglutamicibacter antarcticus]|uniref:ATP-binding cassette domain-containing protein n=1 Tax=Arthrobacter terrae TaxID=2935737 RepID=A0A931G9S9_9MICC|nr:ATP-binding cassette domain-containing protein [Arthrobacter terrae]MBG0739002.1 ATP-binding cassette domain-containing protein [Arthrobacter terrae]